ncbi:MAG TPA: hypothetical protein P5513_04580 [Candidatus Diapherotrites archaeon]|nr:hypothetical protein [Candidatus Diapherotrites archaeon]
MIPPFFYEYIIYNNLKLIIMLNTIQMVLEKRGPEYLNQLLSNEVIVTEKLDTYRILFENVNGKLKFFKKDNTEINLIERVLTNIWEDAIIELSIILHNEDLPEGLCFGVAYTPVNKPIRLTYKNLPKYVLTDVTKRNPSTKKVIESYDVDDVNKWAAKLHLGRPPVIFKGKLSDIQKEKLIEYAKGNYEKENNLKNIFGKLYSEAEIIEGVIIKSDNQLMQVQTYEFKILNEEYQKIENSRDFYDLTLLRIISFMDNYKYPKINEGNSEEAYLELICDIFNNYCKDGNISEDVDPKYLNPPSYGYSGDLNLLLIKNLDTIKILEKGNKIHEAVFKIMLSSFRKYKKPFGLLNESNIQKFNTFVYLINDLIKGESLGPIPTSKMITESKIEEASDNKTIITINKKIKSDIDNMKIIASVQKAFQPVPFEVNKGKNKCVIYLIDPQPLTNSHEKNIKILSDKWKVPIILTFVRGESRLDGEKFHISDILKKAQIESFAHFNNDIVPAFFSIGSWNLMEIFQYARPSYEPIAVITDSDKTSELLIQLYFEEEVMGGRIGVDKDFTIEGMENSDKLTAFRAIEDDKPVDFKELTPKSIWGYFNNMVSEYKKWNGTVPKQFIENKFLNK